MESLVVGVYMKINGTEYKIKSDLTTEGIKELFDWELPCAGMWDRNRSTLYIASNMNQEEQISTLIHEIIEALNYHYSVGLKHWQIERLEIAVNNFRILNKDQIKELFDK